jgi:hypothetical protein
MKIIEAHFTVRLDEGDDELDAIGEIEKLLDEIGFAGAVNITGSPNTDYPAGDVKDISFETPPEDE